MLLFIVLCSLYFKFNQRIPVVCNSDAAWCKESRRAGVGWRRINMDSREECEGEQRRENVGSALIAEALALQEAIGQARRDGVKEAVFRSDASELIAAINKEDYPKELYELLNDLKKTTQGFDLVIFEYVNRNLNQIADAIAKRVLRAQPVF